jgi:hypothetical protein
MKKHEESAFDNITNFESKGIWKFKAVCFDNDFCTVKFKELTGY